MQAVFSVELRKQTTNCTFHCPIKISGTEIFRDGSGTATGSTGMCGWRGRKFQFPTDEIWVLAISILPPTFISKIGKIFSEG